MKLIKELDTYAKLREDLESLSTPQVEQAQFTVYKVEGSQTEHVYYGYCRGTSEEAMKASFAQHATENPEEKRGISELVKSNGGTMDGLEFEVVDEVEDEEKAMMRRNEARGEDPQSITGPSFFPAQVWKSAKAKHPEFFAQKEADKLAREQATREERLLRKYPTARKAWAAGVFDNSAVKALKSHPEALVDLDNLGPAEFSKKYNIKANVALDR